MHKKLLLVLVMAVLGAAVGAGAWWYRWQAAPAPEVHWHAGFQIYVDGVKQDFTDINYMSLTPCGETGQAQTKEEMQLEKAHLHDEVGEVVHVHRQGATWGDLVQNMGWQYDGSKPVVGYQNGQTMEAILQQPIQNHQSVVILIGSQDNAAELATQKVSQERIAEVEQQSELCAQKDH